MLRLFVVESRSAVPFHLLWGAKMEPPLEDSRGVFPERSYDGDFKTIS